MDEKDAISLYLQITSDIQLYWSTFGVLSAILVGWLISIRNRLLITQKIAFTFGYFVVTGYIVSSLFNRYRIAGALMNDIQKIKGMENQSASNLLETLTEYSWTYSNPGILIWTSYGLITVIFIYILWSNIAVRHFESEAYENEHAQVLSQREVETMLRGEEEGDLAELSDDLSDEDLWAKAFAGQDSLDETTGMAMLGDELTSEEGEIEEEADFDSVFLGVSTPVRVRPGSEFTATFAAYLERFRDEVEDKLKVISPRSKSQMDLKECRWKKGAEVTVVCRAQHIQIEEPEQKLSWSGKWDLLHFDLTVSEDPPDETVVLKFDVYIDEISVAKLRMDLEVSKKADIAQVTRKTFCKAAESAFASYASEDRKRVLDRVSSLRTATNMDIFMDCLSLLPNEKWKGVLEEEIEDRDLFLLFWSKHAIESPWVEWEWKYALQEKGEEPLQVHPLDPVKEAPPPEELQHIHFNDPLMSIRSAEN